MKLKFRPNMVVTNLSKYSDYVWRLDKFVWRIGGFCLTICELFVVFIRLKYISSVILSIEQRSQVEEVTFEAMKRALGKCFSV